jgi:hypothetical protein
MMLFLIVTSLFEQLGMIGVWSEKAGADRLSIRPTTSPGFSPPDFYL